MQAEGAGRPPCSIDVIEEIELLHPRIRVVLLSQRCVWGN